MPTPLILIGINLNLEIINTPTILRDERQTRAKIINTLSKKMG